ncbi:hypothetical protein ONS96_005295 [Cadophora gregata f. sp. sojae]|nr:hypothetical protein ONS96_005295 [Cadophora gregata f. sp. sojae]
MDWQSGLGMRMNNKAIGHEWDLTTGVIRVSAFCVFIKKDATNEKPLDQPRLSKPGLMVTGFTRNVRPDEVAELFAKYDGFVRGFDLPSSSRNPRLAKFAMYMVYDTKEHAQHAQSSTDNTSFRGGTLKATMTEIGDDEGRDYGIGRTSPPTGNVRNFTKTDPALIQRIQKTITDAETRYSSSRRRQALWISWKHISVIEIHLNRVEENRWIFQSKQDLELSIDKQAGFLGKRSLLLLSLAHVSETILQLQIALSVGRYTDAIVSRQLADIAGELRQVRVSTVHNLGTATEEEADRQRIFNFVRYRLDTLTTEFAACKEWIMLMGGDKL